MLEKRVKNSIIRQILLLTVYMIVFSPFRNKKNKNKKKKPKINIKKTCKNGTEQKKNKSGTKKQFSKKKTQKSKIKSNWKSKKKKKKLEKKNGLFNFHFFSKPDKKKPNKDKSLQNIESEDLHLETVNIVDSLTEEIDKKKRKNKKKFVDLHLETIKKVDNLMEKMEKKEDVKKQGFFENFDFSVINIFKRGGSALEEFEPPEFLQTIPFQMNVTSKQETLEKMGSLKTSRAKFLGENNVTQTKMIQIEKNETALPTEDFCRLETKEEFDSPLITGMEIKDEKKTSKKSDKKRETKCFFTGIRGFDELLDKGIPVGSNIIVAGGPGCGKTIFCSQIIYNKASEGEDCVFLSMEERPDKLKDHMLEFGFKVEEIERNDEEIILRANGRGKISLKRLQPIRLARSIEALLEKASGTLPVDIDLVLDFIPKDFNACLLVLDSISAIETAFSGTKRQYRIYIEQLFRYFEEMNLTTFMITESSDAPHKFSNTGVEEFLADGIFVFYNFQGVKKRTRGAEIYKLRGASHSQKIVPMDITSNGIKITADESCSGQARS